MVVSGRKLFSIKGGEKKSNFFSPPNFPANEPPDLCAAAPSYGAQ
jgi:hypothetical protein